MIRVRRTPIRIRRSAIRPIADDSLACWLTVSTDHGEARGWAVIPLNGLDEEATLAANHAAMLATEILADSVFEFWLQLREILNDWRDANEKASEAVAFGLALVERALIDGYCRAVEKPFAIALRDDDLGIDLGLLCKPLSGRTPDELLPVPADQLVLQYAVNNSEDFVSARGAGFVAFNIGLSGDVQADFTFLTFIAEQLDGLERCAVSLEGNAAYRPAELRALWEQLQSRTGTQKLLCSMAFIEQPFAVDDSLSNAAVALFAEWPDRPPILIDEAAAAPGALGRALEWGYAGQVYRASRGIIPGVVDACLLGARMEREPVGKWTLACALSANQPLALPAELAIAGALGLKSVIAPAALFASDIQLPEGFTNPIQTESGVIHLNQQINPPPLGTTFELAL